jgi:hypothetical protein
MYNGSQTNLDGNPHRSTRASARARVLAATLASLIVGVMALNGCGGTDEQSEADGFALCKGEGCPPPSGPPLGGPPPAPKPDECRVEHRCSGGATISCEANKTNNNFCTRTQQYLPGQKRGLKLIKIWCWSKDALGNIVYNDEAQCVSN